MWYRVPDRYFVHHPGGDYIFTFQACSHERWSQMEFIIQKCCANIQTHCCNQEMNNLTHQGSSFDWKTILAQSKKKKKQDVNIEAMKN